MSSTENSAFLEVNGYKVWFEKFGSGPNIILLIPGPIGTGRTDFEELLDGEDELDFDKFTVVAVEAPGWGRSRPPVRKYGNNTYNNDCECFHAVMQVNTDSSVMFSIFYLWFFKHLGYDKYSVVGWSEGAKMALLMAIKYQQSVESLVLASISSYVSNRGLISIMSTKTVDNWNKKTIDSYLRAYKTKDEIQKLWTRYIGFIEHYNQYFPDDMFKNKYDSVRCPVLLVHGDQDPIIESAQPLSFYEKLPNVRIHRFPKGEHDSHKKYAPQFTKLVQEQIINKNKKYSKENDPNQIHNEEMDQIMNNNIQL